MGNLCGKKPCDRLQDYADIVNYRLNGGRDTPVPGTPEAYIEVYSECFSIIYHPNRMKF